MAGYTQEQMQKARRADLFLFMQYHFPNEVIKQGNSLRLKRDHSVSIKRGYSGAYDFSSDKGYSGIDLLMEYFGYCLPDAVKALAGEDVSCVDTADYSAKENNFSLPERSPTNWRVKRYLTQERGLSAWLVNWLIQHDLLFEDLPYHNAVFLNHDKNFGEFRGTVGTFHKVQKKHSDGFWFMPSPTATERPKKAYICESAIDCISLFELRQEQAFYCSMAGVSNYGTIERLKRMPLELVLAVDADGAGERCRQKFSDLPSIIPDGCKDWNEMLQKNIKLKE